MKLHRDSREFIELLNSHTVDYIVVGGLVGGPRGPRLTRRPAYRLGPLGS